jgi:hypothetical protein
MTISVSDKFSNLNDNLDHAAKVLRRSKDRRNVFAAIYRGKKLIKTQEELRKATGLSFVRILQEAGILFSNNMIQRQKIHGHLAFKKEPFFSHHKDKILSLALNKEKLARLPTKTNPRSSGWSGITIRIPARAFRVVDVTIDDIDNFSKVRRISHGQQMRPVAEQRFKEGVKKIIGEKGRFTDWGGEKNDLFTTRVRLKKRRLPSAFAFKGKGKKGVLKPKDFGKNGDQIQRLFQSDAQVLVLQYWGQLDQAVYEQMKTFAIAKSALTGEKIYFGVIDGDDTQRLKLAYPQCFKG